MLLHMLRLRFSRLSRRFQYTILYYRTRKIAIRLLIAREFFLQEVTTDEERRFVLRLYAHFQRIRPEGIEDYVTLAVKTFDSWEFEPNCHFYGWFFYTFVPSWYTREVWSAYARKQVRRFWQIIQSH